MTLKIPLLESSRSFLHSAISTVLANNLARCNSSGTNVDVCEGLRLSPKAVGCLFWL